MMKFVFRADSSLRIGSGHIMRCLTLADQLKARGSICHFICRAHEGNINQLVRERGHLLHELPREPGDAVEENDGPAHINWLGQTRSGDAHSCIKVLGSIGPAVLIVDHYALDAVWENLVQPYCKLIVVIDDLADRPHFCAMLLDQNLGRSGDDYASLVPTGCKVLCGPEYALLRPEFSAYRAQSLAYRAGGQLQSIVVSMGGVDAPDATGKVLQALTKAVLPPGLTIQVLMGSAAPWIESVRQQAAAMPWKTTVHVGVNNVGELLAHTDLVIGAAGGSAWERCALGVPALVVILADNQRDGAKALAEQGAAILLGEVSQIESALPRIIEPLLENEAIHKLSCVAAELTDGNGVEKVLDQVILKAQSPSETNVRRMVETDLEMVLAWRNDPGVREFMYSQQEISWDSHLAWFNRSVLDSSRHLLIFELKGIPTGFISFHGKAGGVADWGFYLAPGAAKGTGGRLGEAALTYGFSNLNLHKVCGEVLDFNLKSVRFHERLGFEREGVLRKQHFHLDSYIDVILFGLLAEDWKAMREIG